MNCTCSTRDGVVGGYVGVCCRVVCEVERRPHGFVDEDSTGDAASLSRTVS